jgi:plastocyanin
VRALLAIMLAVTPASAGVKVGDDYYRPSTAHVRKGGSVTWHWGGHRRHDVYFTRGHIARCKSRRGGSCTRRFSRRGSYSYICTLHAGMRGRVVVR